MTERVPERPSSRTTDFPNVSRIESRLEDRRDPDLLLPPDFDAGMVSFGS